MTALTARVARVRRGRPSAVIVPLPEAGSLVPGHEDAMPPHVTVVYPFRPSRLLGPDVEEALGEIASRALPFDVTLARIGRFPGVLYAAPEPVTPFVDLTEACVRRWPQYPPYSGRFAEIIPHVTLHEGPEPAGLADMAAARLPLRACASEVWLMARGRGGHWTKRLALPMGTR